MALCNNAEEFYFGPLMPESVARQKKERTMSRNYYYEKMAKQRESELSQKAANYHLFKDAEEKQIAVERVKQLILRFVPIIIFLTCLVLKLLS